MYLFVVGGIAVTVIGFRAQLQSIALVLGMIHFGVALLLKRKLDQDRAWLAEQPKIKRKQREDASRLMETLSKDYESSVDRNEAGLPGFTTKIGEHWVDFRAAENHVIVSSPAAIKDFRLFVYPEVLVEAAFRNVVDVQLGDSEFDPRFSIQTNDSQRARDILGRKVKESISELADLVEQEPFGVTLNGGQIRVFLPLPIPSQWTTIQQVLSFVESFQHELGVGSSEVLLEVLNVKGVFVASCLVCGDPISDDKVNCAHCKTAHHRDCWEFVRKCSVFGCGSKRFES